MWATVDEFPGVFATRDDLGELRESLEEAISLVLADWGQEPPPVRLTALKASPAASRTSAELVYA